MSSLVLPLAVDRQVMDASLSHGRSDSIVSKPPLLAETPKKRFEMESPIFGLPNELTLLIFHHFPPDVQYRMAISHTCRRWRCIAVNDATLWTSIYIQNRHRDRNKRLDCFLSFLGIQLDRTADLLLDVIWTAEASDDVFAATLQLIRERAPFFRWRTLNMKFSGRSYENAPWSSSDAFTNLEVLCGWCKTDNPILGIVDRTITSHFKVLNSILPSTSAADIMSSFPRSLTYISALRLHSVRWTENTPFPPENVVNLQLEYGMRHPFPHIRTYELRGCIFDQSHDIDLRSMTTLIVTGTVTIHSQLFLPALRDVKLGNLRLNRGAKFEAPSLDHLHFIGYCNPGFHTSRLPSNTRGAILHPGYLLSPNTSIIIDKSFPIRNMIETLASSPKLTHATLHFDNWKDAQVVLERLVGFGPGASPQYTESECLCPRLSELRLNFDWGLSELSVSKEWLLDALKARRESGFMNLPSIYVGWTGEGTYILLTGG